MREDRLLRCTWRYRHSLAVVWVRILPYAWCFHTRMCITRPQLCYAFCGEVLRQTIQYIEQVWLAMCSLAHAAPKAVGKPIVRRRRTSCNRRGQKLPRQPHKRVWGPCCGGRPGLTCPFVTLGTSLTHSWVNDGTIPPFWFSHPVTHIKQVARSLGLVNLPRGNPHQALLARQSKLSCSCSENKRKQQQALQRGSLKILAPRNRSFSFLETASSG